MWHLEAPAAFEAVDFCSRRSNSSHGGWNQCGGMLEVRPGRRASLLQSTNRRGSPGDLVSAAPFTLPGCH